jgi:cation diffusion facilitator family transporter
MKIDFTNDKVCTIVGLIVNTILVITKFLIGIIGKSQAMIADSLHSLSDGIATVSVYFGIILAQKPADEEHPYGHGNIEVVIALFVSILLLTTGIFLGYSATHSIVHKHFVTPQKIAIYGAVISIFVKEILYRYTILVGKKFNSPAIIANAYDHRSDAYSSIGSFVAILGSRLGLEFLDAVGGIIISLFILKMGIDIIRDNIKIIMDTVPNNQLKPQISKEVNMIAGVKNSSPAKIHLVGRKYFLEITISVDKNITVEEGHRIAETVKEFLLKQRPEVKDVTIHVEPD